jgi:hypothetical protein
MGTASGACAGEFLVQRAGTDQYALLPVSFLAELSGPRVKSRPHRLNFFDVLRASLGDPQFVDVCLVSEAPYFHERALHSCNSDSAPSTILNSVRGAQQRSADVNLDIEGKGTLPRRGRSVGDCDALPSLGGRPRGHSLRMTLKRWFRNGRGYQDPPHKAPRHSANARPHMKPTGPTAQLAAGPNIPTTALGTLGPTRHPGPCPATAC